MWFDTLEILELFKLTKNIQSVRLKCMAVQAVILHQVRFILKQQHKIIFSLSSAVIPIYNGTVECPGTGTIGILKTKM